MLTRIRETIQTLAARCAGRPHHPAAVDIRTPRLRLREFREVDERAFHRYRNDPEVCRYLGRNAPWTEEETRQFVSNSRSAQTHVNRQHYNLAVARTEDDLIIGDCSLGRFFMGASFRRQGAALIGYAFDRRYWGQGYATEAADALLRFAFEQLRVARVFGGCSPDNTASRRVMEKAGLHFSGERDQFPGSPAGVHSLVFRAERKEWLAGRKRPATVPG